MAFAEFTEGRSLAGIVTSFLSRSKTVTKAEVGPQETLEQILARRAGQVLDVTAAEGGQRNDMSMLRNALYAKDA